MLQIHRILFPTDFSESAQHAFETAVFLARQFDAELHLVHIIALHHEDPYNPAHHFLSVEDAYQRLRDRTEQLIRATVDAPGVDGLMVKQEQVRAVSPAPAIVDYATEHEIDLVVMSTHGRRGVRHLLMGSVTEEVVRTAPCPVLSIPLHVAPDADVRRILVPTDFSTHARDALAVAAEVAATYGAGLQLLHVLENVLHPAFYNMGASKLTDLQPDIVERTEKELRRLSDEVVSGRVPVEVFAAEGHPGRDVPHFADEHETDLIVITSHGRSGLDEILLGGVTEKVIRRSKCPVLVLKAFGRSIGE